MKKYTFSPSTCAVLVVIVVTSMLWYFALLGNQHHANGNSPQSMRWLVHLNPPNCMEILTAGHNVSYQKGAAGWTLLRSGDTAMINYTTSILQKLLETERAKRSAPNYFVFIGDSTIRLRADAFMNLVDGGKTIKIPKSYGEMSFLVNDTKGQALVYMDYIKDVLLLGPNKV